MARAKRTARAEARRRHREQLRADAEARVEAEALAEAGPPGTAPQAASQRRSIWSSLTSGLFSLPDVRGDLRALPWIARHTYAFVLPLVATVTAFLFALDPNVFALRNQAGEPLTAQVARALFQFVLLPPTVTVVFVGAVLAPRAGWIVGPIVGLVASGAYLVLVAIHGPSQTPPIVLDPASAIETLLAFVPLYVLLGAFAAWYRRWLTQMSERNRLRAEEQRKAKARDSRRTKAAPARR